MFADPITITYNSVTKDLNRINNDNFGSDYFLDDTTLKFSLSIRHTIPVKGGTGESHMIRLDVDEYDGDGVFVRRTTSWQVIKTFDAAQDSTVAGYVAQALTDYVDSTGIITKLVGRQN